LKKLLPAYRNESRHSKSCLPENACKFLFISYAFVCVALVSMSVVVGCAVRVHCRSPCDDGRRMTLKMALIFIYCCLISLN
ncbi:hypothetical protein T11_2439, partial [Trichinella zimbabwensis]